MTLANRSDASKLGTHRIKICNQMSVKGRLFMDNSVEEEYPMLTERRHCFPVDCLT